MNFLSNLADSIPVVGHVKGIVHYAAGDTEGGNKAMYQATRTTAVLGAGAAGSLGGPGGAVVAAMYAGAITDGIASVAMDKPQGLVKGCKNIAEDINEGKNPMGSIASTGFQVGMDGIGGLGMGGVSSAASQVTGKTIAKGAESIAKTAVKTVGEKTLEKTVKMTGEEVVKTVAKTVTEKAVKKVIETAAVQAEIALVSTHVCMQADERTKEEEIQRRSRERRERERREREARQQQQHRAREQEQQERRERDERQQQQQRAREQEQQERRERDERQQQQQRAREQEQQERRERDERQQQQQRAREQEQQERRERDERQQQQQRAREQEQQDRREREERQHQQRAREHELQERQAREQQEQRTREQLQQRVREQVEQSSTSKSNSGSSQPPQGNRNNNNQPKKNKPNYFAIFKNLLEELLDVVFGVERPHTRSRVCISRIFQGLSKAQKDYLGKIIERLHKGGILIEVLMLVIRIFAEYFSDDISFPNFLSLTEFVAVYIQEEIEYQTEVFRMDEQISIENDSSFPREEFENLRTMIISSIMNLPDIVSIISDIFVRLRFDIVSELMAFEISEILLVSRELSSNFRDVFSAIYHYFKHRCVPGDGILSVREYYDWIRRVLEELGRHEDYRDLLQDRSTETVTVIVRFEVYVPLFDRRIRIIVRVHRNSDSVTTVLASCFVLDNPVDGDEEGDVYIFIPPY